MDTTHNTNWLGWLLHTIMVRDEHGCWIPCVHFLTKRKTATLLSNGVIVYIGGYSSVDNNVYQVVNISQISLFDTSESKWSEVRTSMYE